ncbi:AraC family transcriptional regulator [Companilactobacillus zhongbaensis]|uniref:AraC family transcriptional regulator n=1 Tax=Companilactobacillus zhongbaensis TaxID=2486009 RepID=UPI000F771D9E|nr:AraC family transcriptional regulator [Companilactobacillus zhongbaensis]
MPAYYENLVFDDSLPVKAFLHTDPSWKVKDVMSHWHNSIELCYVVKGEPGRTRINGQEYQLTAGEFFVIGPNVIHSFKAVVDPRNEILTLLLPLNWLFDQIDDFNQIHFEIGPLDLTEPKFALLEKSLAKITEYKRAEKPDIQNQVQTISALHYVAAFVLQKMSRFQENDSGSLKLGSPLMIQSVMSEIQNNFSKNITIAQFSQENHISEAHLIRIFKKFVGVSPKNYLVQTRLTKATQLLRQTDLPIHEIAEQTGFGSNKNFFVLFRKHFEMTPNDYRHQNS